MTSSQSSTQAKLKGLAAFGLAALAAWAFGVIGRSYGDFHQPAMSITLVPGPELVFDLWFLAFGGIFIVAFAVAMHHLGWSGLRSVERGLLRPRVPVLLAIASTALAALVRQYLLQRQVITDDEEAYLFIARTLLEGRVVNPTPDEPAFFVNQFVLVGPTGWYGKYPIGHPLVLALGLAVGLVDWVSPLLCGLTTWLTWAWGRRVVGPRRAAWAAVLLTLSPHFVWTYATLLSQVTTCAALMAGCFALSTWEATRRGRWLLGAGAAFGFLFLARPMPGAALAVVALVSVVHTVRAKRLGWAAVLQFGLPAMLGVAVIAAVNAAQSGNPLSSAYHQAHGSVGDVTEQTAATVVLSVMGALVRENFWLFGWPVSLLPVAAARPARGRVLLWGICLSALAYRLLIPKTVVSTTGPTYVFEAVPALALLAADGLARLRAMRLPWRVEPLFVAALASAWVFFVPVEAAAVHRGAETRSAVFRMLDEANVARALVFTNRISGRGMTWAFHAPNPSPRLDDELIFVRMAPPRDMASFAARRFADRPAYVFIDDIVPELVPLERYLARQSKRAPAP